MADIAKHWTIYLIDQNRNLQQFFSYIMVVSFFMKETRENQQPAARNWSNLSHEIVPSTPRWI